MNKSEDWRFKRVKALEQAKTIVVKVGSAVLTNPDGLDIDVMKSLAKQISALCVDKKVVLVSSGAVAAGRTILGKRVGLAAKQATAAVGQSLLMQEWSKVFSKYDIVTAQVLLTREDLRSRKRFLNVRNTFAELLQWGVLPIVNENDTVSVSELKFGDNDCLASLLINLVEGDLFVNLTSSSGVYSSNPQENPEAPILEVIEDIAKLDVGKICGGKTEVGTGGMYSKLLAARRVSQLGVPTLIIPGRKKDVIKNSFDCLENVNVGTYVCPASHGISRRKFWLAYQSDPVGSIEVDNGASKALLKNGSSLLPGGVCFVDGSFQKGALIRICYDGKSIGVGLVNYNATELKKIMGLKREEVESILGDSHYPEVIHRDNMLLDAVL